MAVYYTYVGIPKKNKNPSYQKFKLEHLPFSWDTINTKEVDDDYIDEPQGMTPDDWIEKFKQLNQTTVTENIVPDNELLKLENKLKT